MALISIALQTDKPWNAYGPLAAQVEALGFDGISVYNDLLYQPAWPALFEMARATHSIRLGPAAVNPFTSHPVNIAGQAALLDEASGGRAYLGLARGAWLDFLGLAPENPLQAVPEAFACVRHLLKRSPTPLDGSYFPLAGGAALRWQIDRPDLPFLLGSWGPQLVRACLPFIGEVKLGGTANPGAVRWLRSVLAAAGRPDIAVVVGAVTVVAVDRQAAREAARRAAALYLPVVADLDPSLELDPALLLQIGEAAGRYDFDRVAGLISDDLLAKFAFAGTPSEVAGQAAALVEAGASRIEFGTPHGINPEQGIRLLGEQVLPVLKNI
jgi:5,10-methylenetetrahydromethanopterin reductase